MYDFCIIGEIDPVAPSHPHERTARSAVRAETLAERSKWRYRRQTVVTFTIRCLDLSIYLSISYKTQTSCYHIV